MAHKTSNNFHIENNEVVLESKFFLLNKKSIKFN
jgi:hypothetical protein